MPSPHRDRRGRGIRGPLARANSYTPRPVVVPSPPQRGEFFADAVTESVERVARHVPDVIEQVIIGIEDVPPTDVSWASDEVPMAAAVEPTPESRGRIVMFRRPIEHRAHSRRSLRILVHKTLVEQLAALTGRAVSELDPHGYSDRDDD